MNQGLILTVCGLFAMVASLLAMAFLIAKTNPLKWRVKLQEDLVNTYSPKILKLKRDREKPDETNNHAIPDGSAGADNARDSKDPEGK